MSEPFISEIFLVSFNNAPQGFALCNGQLMPINQNQALFALLGTTYGGNGQTTFALPDLRGRCVSHPGNGMALGNRAGSINSTLDINTMPAHGHASASLSYTMPAASTPVSGDPEGRLFAANEQITGRFRDRLDEQVFNGTGPTSSTLGGGQPHNNQMPYLVLNYIIALQGVFPSQY